MAVIIEGPGYASSDVTENSVTLSLLIRSSESIYTHPFSFGMSSITQSKISSLTVADKWARVI